mmetsp:Transcript_27484/g.20647  ORF Transcript_27484/g.20647 Transcript_27484/m.20647 type:complete len:104 (+) Transcript_27484:486-797(+)
MLILRLTVKQYKRLIMSLADRQYVEDSVFWHEFGFKYVEVDSKMKPREFTEEEATSIWDSLVYLKLKCPSIDIREPMHRVEKFMKPPKEESTAQEAQRIEEKA